MWLLFLITVLIAEIPFICTLLSFFLKIHYKFLIFEVMYEQMCNWFLQNNVLALCISCDNMVLIFMLGFIDEYADSNVVKVYP